MNNGHFRILYNSPKHQSPSAHGTRPLRGVRQDKGGHPTARRAFHQPARITTAVRAVPLGTKTSQSKTVKITLWVRPIVKDDLERRARRDGVSLSSAGATLLEHALQQSLDIEYGTLLRPILKQAIREELKAMSSRLTWLLLRNAFDAGQTRALVTNILGRQPGITPDLLDTILDQSAKTAKGNLARKTPQLTALLELVEKWIFSEALSSNDDAE